MAALSTVLLVAGAAVLLVSVLVVIVSERILRFGFKGVERVESAAIGSEMGNRMTLTT